MTDQANTLKSSEHLTACQVAASATRLFERQATREELDQMVYNLVTCQATTVPDAMVLLHWAQRFQDASRIALDESSEIDREKMAYVMGISATLTKKASDALEVASLVGVIPTGVSRVRPS